MKKVLLLAECLEYNNGFVKGQLYQLEIDGDFSNMVRDVQGGMIAYYYNLSEFFKNWLIKEQSNISSTVISSTAASILSTGGDLK